MGPSAEQSGKALEKVGIFLQSLSPEQIEDLAVGRCRIALVKRQASREVRASPSKPSVDFDQLRVNLTGVESREAGQEYLDEQNLSRADLQALARVLDIPVRKGDNMYAIKESIVEATIGYRLRSDAIRGSIQPEGEGKV
jgi:hypothetical protein